MDVVCTEASGSTEVTGTSDGIVSLSEGCVDGTCVVSCSCTDISSLVLTGQVPGVMLHQIDAARKNCYCWDLVCFVGPNQ